MQGPVIYRTIHCNWRHFALHLCLARAARECNNLADKIWAFLLFFKKSIQELTSACNINYFVFVFILVCMSRRQRVTELLPANVFTFISRIFNHVLIFCLFILFCFVSYPLARLKTRGSNWSDFQFRFTVPWTLHHLQRTFGKVGGFEGEEAETGRVLQFTTSSLDV